MLHRLICFLLFTKNLVPDYNNLFAPYITPTDKIIENVHSQYINEYFHNIIANKNEKVVLVTSVAYDSCNKYGGKTINGTSEFFKNTLDDVEVYISKMFATYEADYSIPYKTPPFDIVEFYQGESIPYEEKIMQYYEFDKCIVYNYNQDKCTIKVT